VLGAPPPLWLARLARLVHGISWGGATLVLAAVFAALCFALLTLLLALTPLPLPEPGRIAATAALVAGLLAAVPIAGLLRLVDELLKSRARLEEEIRRRERIERELRTLAETDPLTGLFNRRAFLERAADLVALARRHGFPVAVLLVDVDHFKEINDTVGHAMGDAVLAALGRTLRASLRQTDLAGRPGGDEFALLLPHTGLEGAELAARRLVTAVRRIREPLPFSISVGVAAASGPDLSLEALLAAADRALYRAKAEGRGRIALAAD